MQCPNQHFSLRNQIVWFNMHLISPTDFESLKKTLFCFYFFGVNFKATLFKQYRFPVGSGPSSNTWPRCESHWKYIKTRLSIYPHILLWSSRDDQPMGNGQTCGSSVQNKIFWTELPQVCPLPLILQESKQKYPTRY